LPKTVFESGEANPRERVRLHIEAGSLPYTLQLVYEPVALEQLPSPLPEGRALWAFALRAFDHEAKAVAPPLRRPWLLEVPAHGLKSGDGNPSRFLLAWYDEKRGRWVFLTTAYHTDRGVLSARLLAPGYFAVTDDRPPYQ
jgi:hypothetical protein